MYNTDHSNAKSPGIRGEHGIIRVNLGDHFITLRRWPGSGPTVFLVHGIGSSGNSWEAVLPGLSASFTPITIDLRGHGDSGKPDTGYLYDNYIADLDCVFEQLGIDHPLIVGHSLGGIVTLWWAARHPDRAAGLTIVDSPLRSGQDFMPAFDDWLAQNAMATDDLAGWYRAKHPDWSEETAARRATVMTNTARNVFIELRADSLAHDGVDRLSEIEHVTSPVLLIRGDPDTGSLVHPEDAIAFAGRLPNARVAHMPMAGHALHRERTEEFLALVIPFLEECANRFEES